MKVLSRALVEQLYTALEFRGLMFGLLDPLALDDKKKILRERWKSTETEIRAAIESADKILAK